MKYVIEVKNLCKSYNTGGEECKILKNLNFKVAKGEFLSLMGPSGCGKSTLLYLLGGLDKPTSGNVNLLGNDLSKISERKMSKLRRSNIGFVFQFYNLIQNLSVQDNILLPVILDGKKVSDYSEKLEEMLSIIGLSQKRNLTPRELSGGQQQRVAIARALIYEPEIVFLDEATGNLDSKTGMEVMDLLRKINKEMNKTLIHVTHSKEVAEYGSRLINLKDGVITSDKKIKNNSINNF